MTALFDKKARADDARAFSFRDLKERGRYVSAAASSILRTTG
jgi:hypothetical protein